MRNRPLSENALHRRPPARGIAAARPNAGGLLRRFLSALSARLLAKCNPAESRIRMRRVAVHQMRIRSSSTGERGSARESNDDCSRPAGPSGLRQEPCRAGQDPRPPDESADRGSKSLGTELACASYETSGFRTARFEKRPKSRSADHSSRTPWSRQSAATRASCTSGPAIRPSCTNARSFDQ